MLEMSRKVVVVSVCLALIVVSCQWSLTIQNTGWPDDGLETCSKSLKDLCRGDDLRYYEIPDDNHSIDIDCGTPHRSKKSSGSKEETKR